MDVEAGRYVLKGAFEAFDVGVKFVDVVLKSFDPAFLLSKTLATFFLAIVDKFRNVVGQSFVFQVADVGKGRTDGGNDGGGEGLRMQGCPCWSARYSGSVEEARGSLDEVGLS